MKIKKIAKITASSIGNGIVATGTVLHNAPIDTRIREIDEELAKLQAERAELMKKRINY
jgi:hypothetical protein